MGSKCKPLGRTLPLPRLSVFCEHRFVVVVGKWIVELGFDERVDGLGRVDFPDFLDEFEQLFGRNPAGLERGNVDDLALAAPASSAVRSRRRDS